MLKLFKKFIDDNQGATAVEYGLILGLIAVSVIAAVGQIGDSLNGMFGVATESVNEANAPGGEGDDG